MLVHPLAPTTAPACTAQLLAPAALHLLACTLRLVDAVGDEWLNKVCTAPDRDALKEVFRRFRTDKLQEVFDTLVSSQPCPARAPASDLCY